MSTSSAPTETEDSKSALLRAALQEFALKGLDGATVKDIAEAAGVNVSLVSYYFGGKEGLYRACLESIGHERLELIARVLKPASSREEFRIRLTLFAEEFIALHFKDPLLMKLIHRDFDGRQPIATEVFKNIFLGIFGQVNDFIESGKTVGIIRSDVDTDGCASLMFGALVHSLHMDFLRQDVLGVSLADAGFQAKFINQYVRNFCDGILERGSP